MLVSVIITTYNNPNFLEQCLNSFLTQKDKNFEIIVADDGSTKDTEKLIKNIMKTNLKLAMYGIMMMGFVLLKLGTKL